MQKQIQKIDINKIADEIENTGALEMYWDYNDRLTDEQMIKIIKEEEGLNDVFNELYDYNIDYMFEVVNNAIKEYSEENNLDLTEEEQEEVRYECESRFDLNIKGLLRNSEIKLRVNLESNEDIIYFGSDKDVKDSETIKEFKRVFRRKYKKEDWERELNNVFDYGHFTFYFKVRGEDILRLREQVLNGFITLRKGLFFGLFDSWNGGGSLLEMSLLNDITLNLNDWRIKNNKEGILKSLEGEDSKYWNVSIKADSQGYGIDNVYGLSGEGWLEW